VKETRSKKERKGKTTRHAVPGDRGKNPAQGKRKKGCEAVGRYTGKKKSGKKGKTREKSWIKRVRGFKYPAKNTKSTGSPRNGVHLVIELVFAEGEK